MRTSLLGILSLLLCASAGCGGAGPGGGGSGGGGGGSGSNVSIGNCPVFPPQSAWNTPIETAPVDPLSTQYIAAIGMDRGLHADFGGNGQYGIPYTSVPGSQPKVPITFDYQRES